MITVKYGVNKIVDSEEQIDFSGMSISQLNGALKNRLGIPSGASVLVNGTPVDSSYSVKEGDTVTFVRNSGQKG